MNTISVVIPDETPNTVHGRLLESAHIAGYTFKRALDELKWLLQEDRWKQIGFADGAAFAESIHGLFGEFRGTIEQRKEVATMLAGVASQRAIAKVLGVHKNTVARDLSGPNGPDEAKEEPEARRFDTATGPNGPPAAFQLDVDPYDAAKNELKHMQAADTRKATHQAINATAVMAAAGTYALIYADPPWKFETYSEKGKDEVSPENHYPVLTYEKIESFLVDNDIKPAKQALLLMWCTASNLPMALKVMAAWGFEYKTNAAWDKERSGTGYYWLNQHELLLLGTRGSGLSPQSHPSSLMRYARGKHSEKPAEIRKMIEAMWPDFADSRIELFARGPIDGWRTHGNQAG